MSIDLRGTEVLVVGAGIMGAGIVQVAALAGHPVKLFDMREGAAAQALEKLAATLKSLVDKGRLDAEAARAAMERMVPINSLAQARDSAAGFLCRRASSNAPADASPATCGAQSSSFLSASTPLSAMSTVMPKDSRISPAIN